MNDAAFRNAIYRHFADTGVAPHRGDLDEWAGGAVAADAALQRLHEAHSVVLDADGSIRMALPFSALATEYRVIAGSESWWANCAWDSLAIPAALGIDAAIEASWSDTGEPVELAVHGGSLSHHDGFVHFTIPARHWWDDIVET